MLLLYFALFAICNVNSAEFICKYSPYLRRDEYYISRKIVQLGVIDVTFCATNLNREILFAPGLSFPINLTVSAHFALERDFWPRY